MASVQEVQSFLAYWFQLGKPLILKHEERECLPTPIFSGDQFSWAFQQCWQSIMEHPEDSFLRGVDESIADLLRDDWEIQGCARCTMPLPLPVRGIKVSPCPCADLSSWPNEDMPKPRQGVCTQSYLKDIQQRLGQRSSAEQERLQTLVGLHSRPFDQHTDE